MHCLRRVFLVMALSLSAGCETTNPAYLPWDGGSDAPSPADSKSEDTSVADTPLPSEVGPDGALPAEGGTDGPSATDAPLQWDGGIDDALPVDCGLDETSSVDLASPWDVGHDGASPIDGGLDSTSPVDATACGDASLDSDPHNCGWCGHDCAGGICTAGVCASLPVANPQGSSVSPWNGFLALGPTHVYFGYAGKNAGGVAMVAKDGTGAACIACDVGMPRELATDSTSVYWGDQGLNEVRKAPLGGSPVTKLWSGSVGSPIAVDGAHVYWHDTGGGAIMQAAPDGANPTTPSGP